MLDDRDIHHDEGYITMPQTPWTRSSSLTSDRIRPSNSRSSATSKNKTRHATIVSPKSKEVRQLESLKAALKDHFANGTDPQGGCFCLARQHPLSSYVPICRTCGLVLCKLNLPHFLCPHCRAALMDSTQQSALLARLEVQIVDTLAKEAEARMQAEEELRQAAGAFPNLPSQGSPTSCGVTHGSGHSFSSTHKVLSLNSKTKNVTVASARVRAPSPSGPSHESSMTTLELPRVPAPPKEVVYDHQKLDPSQPWINGRGERVLYQAQPDGTDHGREKSRRRGDT